ncbi:MAG: branched-chain amino acid ABC transporter permease [Defluviimonas sp.]|nr:branched-chain amino acid ABC transporter permease [Defluviimonas sp.]
MSLELLLQAAVSGFLMGGIYALIALALALVFGVMGVLNFAHGDLLMIGMYGVVLVSAATGLSPFLAGIVMVPAMMAIGWVVFVLLIRPIVGSAPLVQAQLTIGLSFVIQSAALLWFGADLFNVPSELAASPIRLGAIVISLPLLIGFVVALVASGLLAWFLSATVWGYRVRATAEDPVMAQLCGVPVQRVQRWVFVCATGSLAIAAGCLMGFYHVTPVVGLQFSVLSLLIVVLGGLGDLRGAMVAALVLGVAEALTSAIFNSASAPAALYVLFGAALLLKPHGLLGRGAAV